mmetsp:Transcript_5017/g.12791  ORF Transcript_5017/g.12791 Transcript_5017/m.12791 type:complete len:219 (+) Transcript_5017:2704-3360(+)
MNSFTFGKCDVPSHVATLVSSSTSGSSFSKLMYGVAEAFEGAALSAACCLENMCNISRFLSCGIFRIASVWACGRPSVLRTWSIFVSTSVSLITGPLSAWLSVVLEKELFTSFEPAAVEVRFTIPAALLKNPFLLEFPTELECGRTTLDRPLGSPDAATLTADAGTRADGCPAEDCRPMIAIRAARSPLRLIASSQPFRSSADLAQKVFLACVVSITR